MTAPTPTEQADGGLVAALAEALRAEHPYGPWIPEEAARAVLPTVRRVAEQRAAEELLELADTWHQHGWTVVTIEGLRHRAAALTATPNHGRSAT